MQTDDTFKLLNVLDSFHDFKGARNNIPLLDKAILEQTFDSYQDIKDLNYKKHTTGNFEEKLFNTYVTNNPNITTLCKIQLNNSILLKKQQGGARSIRIPAEPGSKKNAILPVLDDIAKYYNIDKNNIVIVKDRGEYIGCRQELSYIDTYAAWFDGASGTICKNPKNMKLDKSVEVTNDLFYIDSISGKYENGKYIGNIKFSGKQVPFSQGTHDKCRANVQTFSKFIKTIKTQSMKVGNQWIDEQLQYIYQQTPDNVALAVNNCCMFLMDLKRAGDALQIESCRIKLPDNKIPIFVTLDRIAAIIALNKGVRTILTTIGEAGTKTATAVKYAFLLEPSPEKRRQQPIPERIIETDEKNKSKKDKELSDNVSTYTSCIRTYITGNTNIMKEYLEFIIKLTDKYVKEDNFTTLFQSHIYNICKTIKSPEENTMIVKNLIIANYINEIFKENYDLYTSTIGDPEEKNAKGMISPMGTIFMEYLLKNIFTKKDADILRKELNSQKQLKAHFSVLIGNKLHDIILDFFTDIDNPSIKKQFIIDTILTPFGYIVTKLEDPRNALRSLYYRIWNAHLLYMSKIIPLPTMNNVIGGRNVKPDSNKKNPMSLYEFMKLPFQAKLMITKHKEDIIKEVFTTFYNNMVFDQKELDRIRYSKKILNIPMEQPINGISKNLLLFRELLYFYPEYIDPVMRTYMTYSNSPIPPIIAFRPIAKNP